MNLGKASCILINIDIPSALIQNHGIGAFDNQTKAGTEN